MIWIHSAWLTLKRRGGGQMAHSKSKRLFFCNLMFDWPQTKLYFYVCLLYWSLYKKLIHLDLGGTLEWLLSARVPQNQPRRVNFRVHFGVHEGPWGFPEPWWSSTKTINVFHVVQRVLENVFLENVKTALQNPNIHKVLLKDPVGAQWRTMGGHGPCWCLNAKICPD